MITHGRAISMSGRDGMSGRCRTLILQAGLIVLLAVPMSASWAEKKDEFVIEAAYASQVGGVYYLNATINYALNETALEALARGLSLTFQLNIAVDKVRQWRPDRNVAELLQLYELQYHALSQRYIVRNLNSGEQQSFQTLSAALLHLGTIRDLPLIDQALLHPRRSYTIGIKSVLDIRSLPGPLRLLAVFFGDWRLASDWYQWKLQ